MKNENTDISEYRKLMVKRQRKSKKRKRLFLSFLVLSAVICLFCFTVKKVLIKIDRMGQFSAVTEDGNLEYLTKIEIPDWVDVQLIHKHNTARSGIPVKKIKNVVIHYVGNPGSTAKNNRDYFDKESTTVSSHFVVGLDGEIIQCLPLWEKSAASNNRNIDTISIEVCHPDETGKFNEKTYNSVVKLTAWLLNSLSLEKDDVIRHYDITGKECPLYYVRNPESWEKLKTNIGEKLNEYKNEK